MKGHCDLLYETLGIPSTKFTLSTKFTRGRRLAIAIISIPPVRTEMNARTKTVAFTYIATQNQYIGVKSVKSFLQTATKDREDGMSTKFWAHIAIMVGCGFFGWISVEPAHTELNVWAARTCAATIFAGIAALLCMCDDFAEIVHNTVLKRRDDDHHDHR